MKYKNLSKRFRTLILLKKDMTLVEFSKEVGIKYHTLYRKITGTRKFTEEDIKKILKSLDVKFEEVFFESEEEEDANS